MLVRCHRIKLDMLKRKINGNTRLVTSSVLQVTWVHLSLAILSHLSLAVVV